MIYITDVQIEWDTPVMAWLFWPRKRLIRLIDGYAVHPGWNIRVCYTEDGQDIEEHFVAYPTPSGFTEFILTDNDWARDPDKLTWLSK
jgi:hypothetical protein